MATANVDAFLRYVAVCDADARICVSPTQTASRALAYPVTPVLSRAEPRLRLSAVVATLPSRHSVRRPSLTAYT